MLMASATIAWTLAELHRLPDDGNKLQTTRRRDHEQKRAFYLRIGVAEYFAEALGQ
ncbi:MAG: hypothetical protein ABMA00_11745 [Gemmatimonas sp.]